MGDILVKSDLAKDDEAAGTAKRMTHTRFERVTFRMSALLESDALPLRQPALAVISYSSGLEKI